MERTLYAILIAVIVIGVIGLSGCAGDGQNGSNASTITGAGATFAMPLITLWASEFENTSSSRVNYNSIGSGGGIRAHIDRTVGFAATEAPLNDEQFENAPRTLTLPFTIGTVTIAFNIPDIDELNLTGEVLADIYLGTINRWNHGRIQALNEDVTLPECAISVVHRSDGSGTTYVFADYLSKVSPRWADEVGVATSIAWPTGIGGNGNEGVGGAVRNNPCSIGYIELSYAASLDMPVAAVQNPAGHFVLPSLEGGTAAASESAGDLPKGHERWEDVSFTNAPGADAYPISSFSYFLVYEDLAYLGSNISRDRAEDIVEWLEWAVTDGQQYNRDVHNASIPESVQQLNIETLDRIVFEGERLRPW